MYITTSKRRKRAKHQTERGDPCASVSLRVRIRRFQDADFGALIKITMLAFAPIHESFREVLGRRIFDIVYPDWRKAHRKYLTSLCKGEDKRNILVAEVGETVVGFASYSFNREKKSGELGLNAVHPKYQRKGIATKMYRHTLKKMKAEGIRVVHVGTGGDPSHLPARRAYEKCGFVALPLVRYYVSL